MNTPDAIAALAVRRATMRGHTPDDTDWAGRLAAEIVVIAGETAAALKRERRTGFYRRGSPGSSRIKPEPDTNATLVSGEKPR